MGLPSLVHKILRTFTFLLKCMDALCIRCLKGGLFLGSSQGAVRKDSGSSNGTGKVDFDSQETAERAIRELNGTTLDGCKILVQSLADVPAHFWQLGNS